MLILMTEKRYPDEIAKISETILSYTYMKCHDVIYTLNILYLMTQIKS